MYLFYEQKNLRVKFWPGVGYTSTTHTLKLDLLLYLGMYSVINVEYLKLFGQLLLDHGGNDKVILQHVEDSWFD